MSDYINKGFLEQYVRKRLVGQRDPVDLLIDEQIEYELELINKNAGIILTKHGIPSKRNRTNYSRRPKSSFYWYKDKDSNPEEMATWLQLLQTEAVNDPKTTEGKLFRKRFRIPPPVFWEIFKLRR